MQGSQQSTAVAALPQLRRVRVVTGYAGLSRFMGELSSSSIGETPRQIKTPYAFGPTHTLYRWNDKAVFIAETRHRRYEVFAVEGGAN